MTYREEILEEFECYSSIDYRDNLSLSEVWQHIGGNKEKKDFGFVQKSNGQWSKHRTADYERLELFSKTLIEFGNLKYAIKLSKIGWSTAIKCISILNNAAEERGLPKIFNKQANWARPNIKLTEKQVSFIKYLVKKYSTYKVSRMYNVSQSTIHQIKNGFTWKNIKPVI